MAKSVPLLLVLAAALSMLRYPSLALQLDFCVASLNLPATPAGYPCKPQPAVTSDDFFSRALAARGPTIPPFNAALASAGVTQVPGLNGLGLSASRVDIAPGGVVPLHTHPDASELLIVSEGKLVAGFISAATNTVYTKTVSKGEIFVFPRGLLHFQYNAGDKAAVVLGAYDSNSPGLQVVDFALFKSTLPADVVTNVTYINQTEVSRLKALFAR